LEDNVKSRSRTWTRFPAHARPIRVKFGIETTRAHRPRPEEARDEPSMASSNRGPVQSRVKKNPETRVTPPPPSRPDTTPIRRSRCRARTMDYPSYAMAVFRGRVMTASMRIAGDHRMQSDRVFNGGRWFGDIGPRKVGGRATVRALRSVILSFRNLAIPEQRGGQDGPSQHQWKECSTAGHPVASGPGPMPRVPAPARGFGVVFPGWRKMLWTVDVDQRKAHPIGVSRRAAPDKD